ncbi:unnamed protein product [Onchocerca flexuosa]|uniref:Uncharacterized protein n=1 Tax=Onchocerca flexuosa TaxID=387005 RepID=A0A183HQ13_9BILA|nr:unnamed protein product [Onchocerca flexuosa]
MCLVVPVPGTFTRGRWKCWDYKDQTSETGTIIDFTDKSEKHPLSINIGENPVGCRTFIPHGQADIMNHTSESHLITATDTSSAGLILLSFLSSSLSNTNSLNLFTKNFRILAIFFFLTKIDRN